MSCPSCGSNSCFCVPRCPEDCPEVTSYSAENINLSGVGVLDGTENQVFQFRGVRSLSSPELTVTLDADFNTIDLELNVDEFQTTVTFDNAATRANTVPDFVGQFGYQIDTGTIYTADGLVAGDWVGDVFQVGHTMDTGAVQTTIRLLNPAPFTFFGNAGTGVLVFDQLGEFRIDSAVAINILNGGVITIGFTSTLNVNCPTTFGDAVTFDSNTRILFATGSEIQFGAGSVVPANAVLITSATAGELAPMNISAFLSDQNTQVYGSLTGSISRAAYTVYAGQTISNPPTQAEVQALDDAVVALSELVAAILTDLTNTLKPSF